MIITFDQYRRLIGLLEHLLFFVGAERVLMYGLYGQNFRRGLLLGPATKMFFYAAQYQKFRHWLSFLMVQAGCYFSRALRAAVPIPLLPYWPFQHSSLFSPSPLANVEFCVYSDAFSDHGAGGLGGWAHGDFWHLPLTAEDCELLHITAWEFIALGANIIIWGRQLRGFRVHLMADALATVQILASRAAHSPVMQIIHDAIMSLPEFGWIVTNGLQHHLFGECNALADAASRGKFQMVLNLAEQMGLIARQLIVPQPVLSFVNNIRDKVVALRSYEANPSATVPARVQSREELLFMRHLGPQFLGADDNPPMFMFRLNSTCRQRDRSEASNQDPPNKVLRHDYADAPHHASHPTHISARLALTRPTSPPCLNTLSAPTTTLGVPHLNLAASALSPQYFRAPTVLSTVVPHMVNAIPMRAASRTTGFLGPSGRLPPVPTSHILVDDLMNTTTSAKRSPLVEQLMADSTDQALRPSDPVLLEAYARTVSHALVHADPLSSQEKSRTSWKYWTAFMALWNSPPLRTPDPLHLARENFLKAAFLLWVRREARSSLPGRTQIKVSTAVGHLYRVAKIHQAHDLEFTTKKTVHQVVKYLAREYELVHGPEALVPRRREGFSRKMLRSMLANLHGLRLRSREHPVIESDSWLGRNIKAALCLSSAGGFRKAEVSLAPGEEFHAMHMSRASLFFIVRENVERAPSQDTLRSMKKRDRVGVLAVPCKNDPLGLHFLPFPLIFNFNPDDNADLGLTLRDLALHCWVPADELRATPMFTYSKSKKALRRDFLDLVLKALLLTFLTVSEADQYSWHSFRIGLACSLRAAGAPDWVIMALCRWRSAASIPVYARINYAVSADWIDEAGRQQVASIQVPNLPGMSGQTPPRRGNVPSELPEETYSLLEKALAISDTLEPSVIHSLVKNIPETDDDEFMREALDLNVNEIADIDN